MEPGYVITKLNDREVNSIQDLVKVYKSLDKGTKVMFEGFYEEYPDEYLKYAKAKKKVHSGVSELELGKVGIGALDCRKTVGQEITCQVTNLRRRTK